MKALIIYDDFARAVHTKAVLQRVANQGDVAIKWAIRPWRMDMLKASLTARQVLDDAASAHLIVFAVCSSEALPLSAMDWLEQWASLRHTPDAALALIGDASGPASPTRAIRELSDFARRHGLSFISESPVGIGAPPSAADSCGSETARPLIPFTDRSHNREVGDGWDLRM